MKKEHFYAIYNTNKKLYLSHGQSTNYSFLKEKVKDTNNDIQVVTISKELYDFLVSQSNGDTWIDIAEYQPTPITIPYTNLVYDHEKLKNRARVWKKIQEEDPEFKDVPNHDALKFQPWTLISRETHTHFEFYSGRPWCSKENPDINNIILDEDDKNLDITGIYMTHLNGNNDINRLTTFKSLEYDDTPIELDCCGVSDNATQVKKHLEKCIQVYQYGNDFNNDLFDQGENLVEYMNSLNEKVKFVLLLTPIVNEHDSSHYGGWRWHKWGEYIGKHTIQYEYLDHEEGIDFIFVWELIPVIEN